MLADISSVDAIYIVCGRTDMHKSIDRMSDEELELLAPWNENVKTEIQHRINNTDQSDVNCQGSPAAEK